MKKMLLVYAMLGIFPFIVSEASGHGLGGDVAPPIDFNGMNVTVSTNLDPYDITVGEIDNANIAVRFFDLNDNQTLEKVTYRVQVWRSDDLLANNLYYDLDGNLDINVRPIDDCDEIRLIKCTDYFGAKHPSAPGALYARAGEQLLIKGPIFDKGGLYNIRVDIEGATSPKTLIKEILSYDTFVSVAQEQPFSIQTANAEVDVVVKTYYDEIEDFAYDKSNDAISFSMPFDWSPDYLEQVSIVHEEIQVPKTFLPYADGKQFRGFVDGVEVDQRVLVSDPFSYDDKNVIHFLVTGKELMRINDILGSEHEEQNVMNFKLIPGSKVSKNTVGFYLVDKDTGDRNGITADISWDSSYGVGDKIPFEIAFFDDQDDLVRDVRYAYVLSDHASNKILLESAGNDPQNPGIYALEGIDTQVLTLPTKDVYRLDILVMGQGTIGLDFDTKYAGVGSAIIEIGSGSETSQAKVVEIPTWVKTNAGWWSTDQIDDETFVGAIKYLINNDVIVIPETLQGESSGNEIPGWIKTNAGWWSTDQIDDETFVRALQYLIEKGILSVGE